MTKGQRTIAALLGAVGVLLALNLVKGEPEAQADHGPPGDLHSAAPFPVALSATIINVDKYRVFRLWSDGAVDSTQVKLSTTGCSIQATCTVAVID